MTFEFNYKGIENRIFKKIVSGDTEELAIQAFLGTARSVSEEDIIEIRVIESQEKDRRRGKQRKSNYSTIIAVYDILLEEKELRHDEITEKLDPKHEDFKLHHTVSAALSGNPDIFLNRKSSETWVLQPDADRWLIDTKPKELATALQKKATNLIALLRPIAKGEIQSAPAWLEAINE
jgi:hypothetical protein